MNKFQSKLILSISLFLLWSFFASAAKADDYHWISTYVGKSTNDLIWNSQYQKAVEKFFGNQKNSYLGTRKAWKISDSMRSVLGGPPDTVIQLDNGYIVASACRAHSCDEKGMLIYDPATNSIAFAMLHYFLEEKTYKKNGYVTIFIKKDAIDGFVNEAISISQKWRGTLTKESADSKYSKIDPEFRIEKIQ
jgi:hypothetical protein